MPLQRVIQGDVCNLHDSEMSRVHRKGPVFSELSFQSWTLPELSAWMRKIIMKFKSILN